MASNSFTFEIMGIEVHKFAAMSNFEFGKTNKVDSIDITAQVHEIQLYESIFMAIRKAELTVIDPIGLMTNFPLSGEEIVVIRYKNVQDGVVNTMYGVIDAISDINIEDTGRVTGYMMTIASIEAYANAKRSIMKGYRGNINQIALMVMDEFIVEPTKKFFPAYQPPRLLISNHEELAQTVVIPNMHPFKAMNLLSSMAVSEDEKYYSYMFFQTVDGFHFRTIEDMITDTYARQEATVWEYRYMSNEIDNPSSTANNDGRTITNLYYNQRYSTYEKMSMGFFHNKFFEVNLGQKRYFSTERKYSDEDLTFIHDNKLNTDAYIENAMVESANDEQANRVRYSMSVNREDDPDFPIQRFRNKWGKEMISSLARSQIDLTVAIAGTNKFKAGSMFSLSVPEMHGFNQVKEDDLISGMYLVTEVKHILKVGGYHTTVLRISKDSYRTSIDRKSRYV